MNPELKITKDCLHQLLIFSEEAKMVLDKMKRIVSDIPEINKLIENLDMSIDEAYECLGIKKTCEGDSCKL